MSKVLRICTILLTVLIMSNCSVEPLPAVPDLVRPPRQTLPQKCAPLYNVGRHKEWAECMGVGYVITRYLHDARTGELLSSFSFRGGRCNAQGAQHIDEDRETCLTIVHEGSHAKAAFMSYAAQRPRMTLPPLPLMSVPTSKRLFTFS